MATASSGVLAAVVLAATTAATSPAHATVVRALSVPEKARIAQAIVVAKVERAEPRWMVEGGAIKTLVTLSVETAIKGKLAAKQKITVVVPGGKIGELVHEVPGVSRYVAGERAVLFLEPHPDGWVELGIGIGKYDVSKKQIVTHTPLVAQMRAVRGEPSKIEPGTPMPPTTLTKFLAEVRGALEVSR
jgi:hypothetical protein